MAAGGISYFSCRPGEPRASCPGGKPGDCAGGLSGIPCARCPGGQTWAGKECAECSGVTFVLWAIRAVLKEILGVL